MSGTVRERGELFTRSHIPLLWPLRNDDAASGREVRRSLRRLVHAARWCKDRTDQGEAWIDASEAWEAAWERDREQRACLSCGTTRGRRAVPGRVCGRCYARAAVKWRRCPDCGCDPCRCECSGCGNPACICSCPS